MATPAASVSRAVRPAIWWEGFTTDELTALWPSTSMRSRERFVEENRVSSADGSGRPREIAFAGNVSWEQERGPGILVLRGRGPRKGNNCLQAETMGLLYEILIFRADQCPLGLGHRSSSIWVSQALRTPLGAAIYRKGKRESPADPWFWDNAVDTSGFLC